MSDFQITTLSEAAYCSLPEGACPSTHVMKLYQALYPACEPTLVFKQEGASVSVQACAKTRTSEGDFITIVLAEAAGENANEAALNLLRILSAQLARLQLRLVSIKRHTWTYEPSTASPAATPATEPPNAAPDSSGGPAKGSRRSSKKTKPPASGAAAKPDPAPSTSPAESPASTESSQPSGSQAAAKGATGGQPDTTVTRPRRQQMELPHTEQPPAQSEEPTVQ